MQGRIWPRQILPAVRLLLAVTRAALLHGHIIATAQLIIRTRNFMHLAQLRILTFLSLCAAVGGWHGR